MVATKVKTYRRDPLVSQRGPASKLESEEVSNRLPADGIGVKLSCLGNLLSAPGKWGRPRGVEQFLTRF